MNVEFFSFFLYLGVRRSSAWPAAPADYDRDVAAASVDWSFEMFRAAHAAGFDSLNLAEHHYVGLTPSPTVMAAAVLREFPDTKVSILGTDLPLHNPVRIAEEYAMLDTLSRGRITMGLFRATPNEYLTYGTNPWESRAAFEEAVQLIVRALTETEPFGWEGRFHRYRNVAIWPHPYQQPHPRLLLSGNSKASARFAARMRADLGFSFIATDVCAANLAAYREEAERCGWKPSAENVLYRQMCLIAETDEEAQKLMATGRLGPGPGQLFNPPVGSDLSGVIKLVGAAMGGAPKGAPVGERPKLEFQPPLVGSPDTVLEQICELEEEAGVGRIELVVLGNTQKVHDPIALQTIELAGEHVIPKLHEAPAGVSR